MIQPWDSYPSPAIRHDIPATIFTMNEELYDLGSNSTECPTSKKSLDTSLRK